MSRPPANGSESKDPDPRRRRSDSLAGVSVKAGAAGASWAKARGAVGVMAELVGGMR